MFDQRRLNFDRRDPLARNTEHVVGTPGIPEVSVFIGPVLIAGMKPLATHSLRAQLGPIPIARRRAFAVYQQIAGHTLPDVPPFLIHDPELVARDRLTRAAGPHLPCPR